MPLRGGPLDARGADRPPPREAREARAPRTEMRRWIRAACGGAEARRILHPRAPRGVPVDVAAPMRRAVIAPCSELHLGLDVAHARELAHLGRQGELVGPSARNRPP